MKGAGIATSITFISSLIITLCYVHLKDLGLEQCSLHWFNSDCLKDWGVYLRMGVPSAAMLCLEWFAFEVIALIVGQIGVVELAAYTAQFNFLQLLF